MKVPAGVGLRLQPSTAHHPRIEISPVPRFLHYHTKWKSLRISIHHNSQGPRAKKRKGRRSPSLDSSSEGSSDISDNEAGPGRRWIKRCKIVLKSVLIELSLSIVGLDRLLNYSWVRISPHGVSHYRITNVVLNLIPFLSLHQLNCILEFPERVFGILLELRV